MIKLFRIFCSVVLLILSFRVDGAETYIYPVKFVSLDDGSDIKVSENQIVCSIFNTSSMSSKKVPHFFEKRDMSPFYIDLSGELLKKNYTLIEYFISGKIVKCVIALTDLIMDITDKPNYDDVMGVNGGYSGKKFGDYRQMLIKQGGKLFYYTTKLFCSNPSFEGYKILGKLCGDDGREGGIPKYFIGDDHIYSFSSAQVKKILDDYKVAVAKKSGSSGGSSSSSGSGGSSKKNKCCCCGCCGCCKR